MKLGDSKVFMEVWHTLGGIFPVTITRIAYYKTKKEFPNLKNPKLFDEKITYLKLYKYPTDPIAIQCGDKYTVREYIKERGCENILNELYGVWEDVESIPFESFPNQFVLKCSSGCHMNMICLDKSQLDISETKKILKSWMKTKQWKWSQEYHYKAMAPRIICEKYLSDGGVLPNDYKIYCFNGKPRIVLINTEREYGHEINRKCVFKNIIWENIDIVASKYKTNEVVSKPKSLEDMLECSCKLSAGIPFVRMDFYDINGQAVFGEMTFTPDGGNSAVYTEDGQKILGKMLQL